MNILIAVDSRHGSTMEIADAIAAELKQFGVDATVLHATDVESVQEYDGVILGSAVYTGHWMKGARQLAVREHEHLIQRPVWLFSSGPIGDPPFPGEEPIEVHEIQRLTGARSHHVFAGKLDVRELGVVEKTMVRAAKAQPGDFRDWTDIRGWADEIANVLAGAPAAQG